MGSCGFIAVSFQLEERQMPNMCYFLFICVSWFVTGGLLCVFLCEEIHGVFSKMQCNKYSGIHTGLDQYFGFLCSYLMNTQ